jgi:hypothetical protein
MHHFESMPSLHLTSPDESFLSSPPASPLSFTTTPSIPGKRSRHTHRRSLAISSKIMLPPPAIFDQNPALITPPLSSPAWSFPKTGSFESLRSDNIMLDYDSDLPRTPNVDDTSLRPQPSIDPLSDQMELTEGKSTPNVDVDAPMSTEVSTDACDVCSDVGLPSKLRKVTFNNSITYYPPRPMSSRQASISSQMSQLSSRETTPSVSLPQLGHRKSLSSFLLPSPSFRPSCSTAHQHTCERRSWAGLITSPFIAARRLRSPNRYRPPTPPLGHDADDDADDEGEMWQPPAPIIDLDAALGPFQTPSSPASSTQSAKFWALTSYVGTHRRSESAPEIRGPDLNTYIPSETTPTDDSTPSNRGLKRKMSVIDEEDRLGSPAEADEEMDVDDALQEIVSLEGQVMGEMGDLIISSHAFSAFPYDADVNTKHSKRRSWRKSLKDWWKKV